MPREEKGLYSIVLLLLNSFILGDSIPPKFYLRKKEIIIARDKMAIKLAVPGSIHRSDNWKN